jgi:hypothetical protein
VQNAVQQIGGAIGLAVLVTLATRHLTHAVATGTPLAVAATDGYALAFEIGGIILAIGAVVVALFLSQEIKAPQPEETLPDAEPVLAAPAS